METETLRALVAGFLSGAAAALASTAIVMAALVRPRWQRLAQSQRVPLPLVGVVFVQLLLLGWTALGLLLGAAYLRAEAEQPAGGLGSTNRLFTLLVVGAVGAALAAAAVVRGRLTWPLWSTALAGALAFGWLLPLLAR